jgi:hypothetical protein
LQALGDKFVGEAVKTVTAHPFAIEPIRNRKMIDDGVVTPMKGGIKAGDLR